MTTNLLVAVKGKKVLSFLLASLVMSKVVLELLKLMLRKLRSFHFVLILLVE